MATKRFDAALRFGMPLLTSTQTTSFNWGIPGLWAVNVLDTNTVVTANTVYTNPMIVSEPVTITAVGFDLNTGIAASTVDVAIYAHDEADPWETTGSDLLGITAMDTEVADAGWVQTTGLSVSLDIGRYLVQWLPTGAIDVRGAIFAWPGCPVSGNVGSAGQTAWTLTKASGALGDAPTAATSLNNAAGLLCPVVFQYTGG